MDSKNITQLQVTCKINLECGNNQDHVMSLEKALNLLTYHDWKYGSRDEKTFEFASLRFLSSETPKNFLMVFSSSENSYDVTYSYLTNNGFCGFFQQSDFIELLALNDQEMKELLIEFVVDDTLEFWESVSKHKKLVG